MSRYFFAPKDYQTPRQFEEGKIPALYLMPEGRMCRTGVDPDNNVYLQDMLLALLGLWFEETITERHQDETGSESEIAFFVNIHGGSDETGRTHTEETSANRSPLEQAIIYALDMIVAAMEEHCPTIYPVETNPADIEKE